MVAQTGGAGSAQRPRGHWPDGGARGGGRPHRRPPARSSLRSAAGAGAGGAAGSSRGGAGRADQDADGRQRCRASGERRATACRSACRLLAAGIPGRLQRADLPSDTWPPSPAKVKATSASLPEDAGTATRAPRPASPVEPGLANAHFASGRSARRWVLAACAVIALAGGAALLRPTAPRELRAGCITRVTGQPRLEIHPALPPDGKFVAYAAGPNGRLRILCPPAFRRPHHCGGRQHAGRPALAPLVPGRFAAQLRGGAGDPRRPRARWARPAARLAAGAESRRQRRRGHQRRRSELPGLVARWPSKIAYRRPPE